MWLDGFEKLSTLRLNSVKHLSTVTQISLASNKSPFLEPVDQPGNVWNAHDHPPSDLCMGEPPIADASEHPEHVVLRVAEVMAVQNFRAERPQI